MHLEALCTLPGVLAYEGPPGCEVTGVSADSRTLRPGELFVALQGEVDGLSFVPAARAAGAGAVASARPPGYGMPWLRLAAPEREVLGPLAEAICGYPSRALEVVGITGTNGKSSCAWMVDALATRLGRHATLWTTLGARLGTRWLPSTMTTPEAPALSHFLAEARDEGAQQFTMEVSSHALAQHRVSGLRFAAAAFTNLSQDHLDYHGDLERYFEAKALLFSERSPHRKVICVDDAAGRRLARRHPEAWTVALTRPADFHLTQLGSASVLRAPRGQFRLRGLPLAPHNQANWLVSVALMCALGQPLEDVLAVAADLPLPPGRMQCIEALAGAPRVVVDYAHTPAALEVALAAARRMTAGQVYVVVGCGGDRDGTKRGPMGGIAARHADRVFLTSDNPRSEDPVAILDAMHAGVPEAVRRKVSAEPDRALAIKHAIAAASSADLVLIAGKGHETVQIIGDERRHFDDAEVAREALAARA